MFEKEVAAGMDFLDNYYGKPSWVLALDLGVLDLKSGCDCVLGQLNGDYDTMCEILDIEESDAVNLGFCLNYSEYREWVQRAKEGEVDLWVRLTGEWLAAIKDRLDQGIDLEDPLEKLWS